MTDADYSILRQELTKKINKSFSLVAASMQNLTPYQPDKELTPQQLEPYDALSARFIRCVEAFIKYFKADEYFYASNKSDTLRDTLNVMEKQALISNVPIWMRMRDVRNKVVHDYIGEAKKIFDDISNEFYLELKFTKNQINKLE